MFLFLRSYNLLSEESCFDADCVSVWSVAFRWYSAQVLQLKPSIETDLQREFIETEFHGMFHLSSPPAFSSHVHLL